MASKIERILILCKTYPSPSAGHTETSCVAGITENGEMRRLYPVPFRLITDEQQFKKWQWISARVEKANNDHRPESHKLFIDTIVCDAQPLSTAKNWSLRRPWIEKLPTFGDFDQAERARMDLGMTLVVVRPARILGLDVKKTDSAEWTDAEKAKLLQAQNQGSLFDETEAKGLRLLRKLPYDFYYRYECNTAQGAKRYRHKLVDWEAGALFWNVQRQHGKNWEPGFRQKLEVQLPQADLIFLMGTIHRFPDQWLIVSLIYPPKPQPDRGQEQLFHQ